MSLSHIPNLISTLRILIVYPVVLYLYQQEYFLALVLFLAASISDLIDGFLARRFNWTSRLGGWLDPIADKLLLDSVFLTLWIMKLVPMWLLVCVLGRDLIIVLGVIVYYFKIEKVAARPTLVSKVNTFMQLVLCIAILLSESLRAAGWGSIPSVVLYGGMLVVLGLTVVSGVGYVVMGARRALLLRRKSA